MSKRLEQARIKSQSGLCGDGQQEPSQNKDHFQPHNLTKKKHQRRSPKEKHYSISDDLKFAMKERKLFQLRE